MPETMHVQADRKDQCHQTELSFGRIGGKRVTVSFDDSNVSSDGGTVLVAEEMRRSGLIDALASAISDCRHESYIDHSVAEMLAQRVLQICNGYADANDSDAMKTDPMFKLNVKGDAKGENLSSQPTMSRLENAVSRKDLVRMGYVLMDQFIASYGEATPKMICLDMDPTAHLVYGQQELGLYNRKVDDYCLMPFHVYEGISGKLITTVIRPGKTPLAGEILTIVKRIVARVRGAWPKVRILFRADSHHTKPEVMDWLEANDVDFVLGLAQNQVLNRECEPIRDEAKRGYERVFHKYRRYHSFSYAAKTWSRQRRVVCRAQASIMGTDLRYIVTNLQGAGAKYLYDNVYCDRGNAELMIKDHKCGLNSDRSSCQTKEANQFRLFVHSAAYVLMHSLRERVLSGTELANATFQTIRLRLLKVGARLVCGKTYVRIHMPESFCHKSIYAKASAFVTAPNTT